MLKGKRAAFVAAYLGEARGNGALAARMAGYRSPTVEASRLLTFAEVAEAVAAGRAEIAARLSAEALMSRDEWLREVKRLAFGDIRRVVKWQANVTGMAEDEDGNERLAVSNQVQIVDSDELSDDAAASVAEIRQSDKGGLSIKLHDKLKALELYAKAEGFVAADGPNVSVNVGVLVDRPPRETREEWIARKDRERELRLAGPPGK